MYSKNSSEKWRPFVPGAIFKKVCFAQPEIDITIIDSQAPDRGYLYRETKQFNLCYTNLLLLIFQMELCIYDLDPLQLKYSTLATPDRNNRKIYSQSRKTTNTVLSSMSIKIPQTKMCHYNDVIKGAIASEITSLMIVYSTVYPDADQRKHQSSASLAFVRGIHRWLVNSPHKWPVTRKMFPFDDVIIYGMCPAK